MKFLKSIGFVFLTVLFVVSCQKDEYPAAPIFNVEVKVNSTLNPSADKMRVVLYTRRGIYGYERSRNPQGDSNKEVTSLSYAFWQITDATGQANFSNLEVLPRSESTGKRKEDTQFTYDTIFIRVEARQITGLDTIYKTNDANPAFFAFPDPMQGNTTVDLQKEITL